MHLHLLLFSRKQLIEHTHLLVLVSATTVDQLIYRMLRTVSSYLGVTAPALELEGT
jgi:hypothetical protein